MYLCIIDHLATQLREFFSGLSCACKYVQASNCPYPHGRHRRQTVQFQASRRDVATQPRDENAIKVGFSRKYPRLGCWRHSSHLEPRGSHQLRHDEVHLGQHSQKFED